jgi:hypothetical protein
MYGLYKTVGRKSKGARYPFLTQKRFEKVRFDDRLAAGCAKTVMNQSLSDRPVFRGRSEKESKKNRLTHFYPAHPEASVDGLWITFRIYLILKEKFCHIAGVIPRLDRPFEADLAAPAGKGIYLPPAEPIR